MRGKAQLDMKNSIAQRITPAYAGKSRLSHNRNQSEQDHPRLCGEKRGKDKLAEMNVGSPPPMRGKALTCGKITQISRITPAYAGKSAHSIRHFWVS